MKNKVVYFEVMGQNTDTLLPFYNEMFDWPLQQVEGMETDYHMISEQEEGLPGGIGQVPQGKGWTTFYVSVDNVEEYVARAQRMGGEVLMPTFNLKDGSTIAVIADPEGHPVGLYTPSQAG